MKRIIVMMLNLALVVGMTSCEHQKSEDLEVPHTQTNITNTDEGRNDDMSLLTRDELIKLCGLTEDEYADKDLDSFINFYKFTEENVRLYNVHNLLANFVERKNVESLLCVGAEKREGDFTKNVECIAFVENKNTSVNSVYIDIKENRKWAFEGDYIFHDLNQYDYKDISNEAISSMLSSINELGVFNMNDLVDSNESISDPMSFTFVVKYLDGTYFRVGRTGIPSEICPKYYDQWRNLLFS